MNESYLELGFNVTHRACAHDWYADSDLIRLTILGPIALFDKYRLTISSGKETEETDNAHVIRSMYKIISSSRDSNDLSIGFHRSNEAQEIELTDNKTTRGIYLFRTFSKDNFDFAEHHDNCTNGLGYNTTVQKKVIFMY